MNEANQGDAAELALFELEVDALALDVRRSIFAMALAAERNDMALLRDLYDDLDHSELGEAIYVMESAKMIGDTIRMMSNATGAKVDVEALIERAVVDWAADPPPDR